MANKVIKIGNGNQTQTDQEIYLDLDMVSRNSNSEESEYSVGKLVNIRAVQNSIDNIFRWIPGERILNPEFGSKLRQLLYEGITDINRERIAAEVGRSVNEFEPRVTIKNITNVKSVENDEDNIIQLDIEYSIKGLDDETYHKQYYFDKNS